MTTDHDTDDTIEMNRDELEQLIDERVEERVKERLATTQSSRRDLLKAGGALGLGGLLGGAAVSGGVDRAAADTAQPDIGTHATPVDAILEAADFTDRGSDPSSPPSGHVTTYVKNGSLYKIDANGTVSQVGGGAFNDTDGDAVAELQTSHTDHGGGDLRGVGKATVSNAEVDSLNSVGWVDASSANGADLNSALTNNPDGAILYNGVMTITESIVIPPDKTLYVYNGAGVKVEGSVGIGGSGMNTISDSSSRTHDIVIDARGNDNCGIVGLGGRVQIDANIAGSKRRHHFFFKDSQDNYVSGFKEFGGRGAWLVDVENATIENGHYDIADDANANGSAVLACEGVRYCDIEDMSAIGNLSATTNIGEVVDCNGAGRNNNIQNVYGEETASEPVDLRNEANSTVSDIRGKNISSGADVLKVIVIDLASSDLLFSSRSETQSDGLTVSNVTRVESSGTNGFALGILKNGDGGTGEAMSFENVSAVKCRLYRALTSNSPTETQTIDLVEIEGACVDSPAAVVNHDLPIQRGWDVEAIARNGSGRFFFRDLQDSHFEIAHHVSGGDGVEFVGCNTSTGTIQTAAPTGDCLVMNNTFECKFDVVLRDSGGYGIRGQSSPDQNHYSGVVIGNANGQSTGLGANSITDLV